MAITGVQVGSSGTFQVVWNGAMSPTASDIWSSNDPLVTLTPDPTDMTKVSAAVAANDVGAQFTLSVSGTNSANAAVTASAVVPILPAPPTPATGGTINQLS